MFIGGLEMSRRLCLWDRAGTKKIQPPGPPTKKENKTKEEEFFGEAFEEDKSPRYPVFKTPVLSPL